MEIGRIIRDLREKQGLSYTDLFLRIVNNGGEITATYLYGLEHGKYRNPSFTRVNDILDALGKEMIIVDKNILEEKMKRIRGGQA